MDGDRMGRRRFACCCAVAFSGIVVFGLISCEGDTPSVPVDSTPMSAPSAADTGADRPALAAGIRLGQSDREDAARVRCGLGLRPSGKGEPVVIERRPLPTPSLRLIDRTPRIAGPAPESMASLLEFGSEALSSWPHKQGVVLSPELGDRGARAAQLSLEVRGGGGKDGDGVLVIVPVTNSHLGVADDRRHRSIRVRLAPLENAEGLALVRVDLERVLRQTWGGALRRLSLQRLEIGFEGSESKTGPPPDLVRVALFDSEVRLDSVAGRVSSTRSGVIMPSWYVRAGGELSFEVDLPAKGSSLVWSGAAGEAGGVGEVSVRFGDEERVIHSEPVGTEWENLRRSLEDWRGRSITLSLRNRGPGVVFFGDPQIHDRGPSSSPDVLVYMIDTLVATRLGAWRHAKAGTGVSPTIDRLAREGITFGHALSPAPWTKPSVVSFFTGLEPSTHGVGATSYTERLPSDVPTLQKYFAEAGFRTGSFAANPLGGALSGLEQGFSYSVTPPHWLGRLSALAHPSARQLHAAALAWLDQAPERPHLFFIHALEVHEYANPVFRPRHEGWDMYDEAIHALDAELARLLGALSKRQRDVIVVLLSDHGESFGDHGQRGHGFSLFESQLHVPLIIWAPRYLPPRTFNRPVSTNDVAPTLLEWFGLEALPDSLGESLFSFSGDPAKDGARPVLASREWYLWDEGGPRWYGAVGTEGEKALRVGEKSIAFRLSRDPCETRGIPAEAVDVNAALDDWLSQKDERRAGFLARFGRSDDAPITSDGIERLRALGYVE